MAERAKKGLKMGLYALCIKFIKPTRKAKKRLIFKPEERI